MKFIRLSQFIVNPLQISKIVVKENSYHMHLNEMTGVILFGSGGFGSRTLDLYKDTHPEDYKIISEWIEQNTK